MLDRPARTCRRVIRAETLLIDGPVFQNPMRLVKTRIGSTFNPCLNAMA
jgi:hypothetical protein